MSASITLSGLGWTTPRGIPLFTDLTLGFGPERTGLVGRNGTGKSTLLRLIAGDLAPQTGTVQRQGRLGWLRQETPAEGSIADLFGAGPGLALLDRAAEGRASPVDLDAADWTLPTRIEAALLRCGLAAGPETPLGALSGGQRTRAALAALVFAEPDVLLLDEPTNNLDRDGRRAVLDLLAGWRAGAVVVSHDRELLRRMDAIVELTPLGATRYGGNYDAYRAQKDADLAAAADDLAQAERTRAETARRAQQAAERKARKDGAGLRARSRGGQPKIVLDAARGRAEGSGGANARLREARAAQAEATADAARARVEVLEPLRMDLPPTGLPPGRLALRLTGLTGGPDPDAPVIRDLSLTLTGPERLALTGPNGSGKTSLLALIAGRLAPRAGVVERPVPFALLDQDLGLLDPDQTLHETFRRLNPGATETESRAALARFRFRNEAAQQKVGALSGGQRLRAGLACALGGPAPPQLLLLDEPTNHLDLDATLALEAALRAYDGALVVVSHDAGFLAALNLDRRIALRGAGGRD